jgi:SAM-dependent methyltransferase
VRSETDGANAEQIAHWNERSGLAWAELTKLLDRQIEGIGERVLEVLAPRPGERLLDVGCGCGQTTVARGRAVGPAGRVVGLDVSHPMLEVARRRVAEAGLAQVELVEADAQTHALEAGAFDGLFSRFGVMFFADPVAAFGNLRRVLVPGARLAFACWRSPAENPVMTTAMTAARHRFPPLPTPVPGAPGPFAFADDGRVRALLEAAGFAEVAIAPHDADMGGNGLEDSLRLAVRIGPLGAALREHPELLPHVIDDVRAAYLPLVRDDGAVWMRSATWIVTARNRGP